jgi:8-oxo-dGTP pyrophosphatase MutT (NUDIX family)
MTRSGEYTVSLQVAAPRTIAAVHARLPIHTVPSAFRRYLDQVYAAARAGLVALDGQNVFVYRDAPDRPTEVDVAFGVGVTAPFDAVGGVRPTALPVGKVATTTHWGSYGRLGAAHHAVIDWCHEHEQRLAGPRWEVYGHWTDDEARLRTDVFYLLIMNDWANAPRFGRPPTDTAAIVRPSAYGLVADAAARLAVVRTPHGLFLPGGGIDPGETPHETVIREVREECGLDVQLGSWTVRAVDFVYSTEELTHFEKHSTFVDAQPIAGGIAAHESDHELAWVAPSMAVASLSHASHRWAVEQWRERGRQANDRDVRRHAGPVR